MASLKAETRESSCVIIDDRKILSPWEDFGLEYSKDVTRKLNLLSVGFREPINKFT